MPYTKLTELPDSVRAHLPHHAQEIYLSTFNNAYDEYKDPKDRQSDTGREETAHKVAWSAVKNVYEKGKDGDWYEK